MLVYKAKYRVNGKPVKNISSWCKDNDINRAKVKSLFYKAKHPTKKEQNAGIKPCKTIYISGNKIVKFI